MTSEKMGVWWAVGLGMLLAVAGCDATTGGKPVATVDGKTLMFKSVRIGQPADLSGSELTIPAGSKAMVVTAEGTAGLGLDTKNVFLADGSGSEVQMAADLTEMTFGGTETKTIQIVFIVPETATGPYKIRFGNRATVDLSAIETAAD